METKKFTEEEWHNFETAFAKVFIDVMKNHVDKHGTNGICWFCSQSPTACDGECHNKG